MSSPLEEASANPVEMRLYCLRSKLFEIASENPHDTADRCLDAFLEIFPEIG